MIYIVTYESRDDESLGYSYFGSRREAEREAEEMRLEDQALIEVEAVKTPTSKQAWLRFLNLYASHPNNG